jgi:hypothetical protein
MAGFLGCHVGLTRLFRLGGLSLRVFVEEVSSGRVDTETGRVVRGKHLARERKGALNFKLTRARQVS